MIKRIKQFFLLTGLGFVAQSGFAYDIANARKINNTCALCHGLYGQGTPGSMSPRLAGLPAKYIAKELAYYRDGTREYAPMVLSSGIKSMTDKDISDISHYLATINLEKMDLPEIPVLKGDQERGKRLFRKECKTCHGPEAMGKPKKGAPMIAGQYASYILSQISKFRARKRYHDDDPEDDTFDDFDQQQIRALAAHLTHLTKQKQIERKKLVASKEPKESMQGMMAMSGMVGMSGMGIVTSEKGEEKRGSDNFAGSFKVTSRGEIILSPSQRDLRLIAGLHGKFKISKTGGLEFHPESPETKTGSKQ